MELRQIEYFLAVAEHEGISGAAAALGVSQPTVSQAIQVLERELKTSLFQRIGRGMILTSAGRALVGPGRVILRDVTAAVESVTVPEGEISGQLHIASTPSLVVGAVPVVTEFRQRHPDVRIRISELRDESRAAGLLRDSLCDIVVAHQPLVDGQELDTLELGEDEYWLAFPPDAVVPDADPLPLADLPDIPMVIVPPGSSYADEIEDIVRRAGYTIRASVVTEHREARLPMVAAGLGATFLERSLAESARGRVIVRAIEPRITRTFGFVFDAASLQPPAAAFVALARELAG
ncbi:LysR family transcriptional regulator [Prescottella equi]|uniref:LysR substrate binding domain protein n=1 Tax=Prescottella equi ATCC 33707 TaxID=525370 RepID=E9T565_RHOHA|nr:LysR family transcriptional regulator [Prescottella equi]EGD22696.1 LysR substrate binding domain protein [Prescottella equi ATCC 33707]MBU4615128.1 LysR family transcriptional regulator [Rhodococcus sp. GG48]